MNGKKLALMTAPLLSLLAFSAFYMGCGSGSNGGTSSSGSAASCTQNAEICTDYTAAEVSGGIQASCVSPGVYSASPCPTANRIGSCSFTTANGNVLVDRFYTTVTCSSGPSACAIFCSGSSGMTGCTFTCG